MDLLRKTRFRLRALFRGAQLDRELDEEMRFHLEQQAREHIEDGAPPIEARRVAVVAFGGRQRVREEVRDARGLRWLDDFAHDIRHGARMLRKRPGFTAAVVLTLALGLSANATIFSFVNDLFLRPLPATDPDKLVVLAQKSPKFQYALPLSYPDFEDFRREVEGTGTGGSELARTFAGMMAYKEEVVHLSRTGESTVRTWVHLATNNYFSVLGVQPFKGRLFLPSEGRAVGADPIIVLTHACWRDRFESDPQIVGQQVKLNGLSFTVVGVTPPGFVGAAWGTALSGFVPVTMHPPLSPGNGGMIFGRGDTGCFIVGRLRSDASLPQARAAASLMMARLIKEYPDVHVPADMLVMPENRSRPSPYVASYVPMVLSAMMALAILVLVVAAANVANLLYARAADRERELAVRSALGASRTRLLRQMVTESLLLALAAGMVGVVVALGVQPVLNGFVAPGDFAPPTDTGMDWRLFAFTLLASAATGILTGLVPAFRATRIEILPVLKDGTAASSRARHPWRSMLVVGQVAVACVVLVCAGLAVQSLFKLSHVRLGFQTDHLLIASLDLDRQRYSKEKAVRFLADLRERMQALPGVRSASFGEHAPFDTTVNTVGDVSPEGAAFRGNASFDFTPLQAVDERYLETTGLTVAEGRGFTADDTAARPRVALISAALARYLWPEGSAVGRRLLINQEHPPIEVVGVLGDGRFWNLSDSAQRFVFLPLSQRYRGQVRLLIRTEGESALVAAAVRQVVREMDPDLPVFGVRTMKEQMESSPNALMPLRFGAMIAGAQGAIVLVLAGLGVFGLVSFAVTRRTREIGIRIALGARVSEVVLLMTRDGLRLVAIGLALGLLASFGVTRLLAGLLYGVSTTDVVVFSVVPALVIVIAILAAWLPARRAARVDPMIALRAE